MQINNFSSNLKKALQHNKFSYRAFSLLVGRGENAVGKWANGTRFPADEDILFKIVNVLNVTIADLLGNPVENRKKITEDEIKNNIDRYLHLLPTDPLPSYMSRIPFYSDKMISEDREMTPETLMIDTFLLQKKYRNKEIVAVMNHGDSMSPYLHHQDIALVEKGHIIGDGKYALDTPYGYVIKNLKFLTNGNIRISSENRSYRGEHHEGEGFDEEISKEMLSSTFIVGLVVGRILKD